jgi:Flp pilus assembly pilin Flp
MNSGETIRAKVELPCSVRFSGSEPRIVRGVTEEVTRESLVVIVSSPAEGGPGGGQGWLKTSANVTIAVELPVKGKFEPRVLECAATISLVSASGDGTRVVAKVNRMTVINRRPEPEVVNRPVRHTCAAGNVPAVVRSQNDNPVIPRNHRTNLKKHSRGEHTMSFLKNFFVEEDGQDMVEYGLVISLVVIGGAIGYSTFSNQIGNALSTLGTKINTSL